MDFRIGDIVGRKSYECDIIFKVHDILKQGDSFIIVLKGVNYRLIADAPENDIIKLPPSKINEGDQYHIKKNKKHDFKLKNYRSRSSPISILKNHRSDSVFMRPGKVLHFDGDSNYLDMCLKAYKEFQIDAICKLIPEQEQPRKVVDLLKQYNPDILVLTGHDSIIKNNAGRADKNQDNITRYKNSRFFIEAVRQARMYEPSLDDLVIFAGACQSYFEGIMAAGANFASSPDRILIHALDPVKICKSIAFAPIDVILPLEELLNSTASGIRGIGGIQTKGKYRDGMPKTLYQTY